MKRANWNHISLSISLALTLGPLLVLFGYIFVNAQANTPSQNATLWLRASDLPDHTQFAGLSRHAVVAYKNVIYVIGGAGTNLGLQSKDIYAGKIENGGSISQWSKNSVLTKNLIYAPAAVTENGCIYLAGGRSGNTAQSSVIFGQASGSSPISWQEEDISGFRARYLHALVISGDKMFALGGFKRGLPSPMGDVDYLNLSDDCTSPTNTWMSAPSLNPTRTAHAAVAFEGKVYVIGGFEGGLSYSDISSSVHSATIQSNGLSQWTELTCTLPVSLAYHTAFISEAERRIYVVGGLTPGGIFLTKFTPSISMMMVG